jgi:beta-glucosidase
VSIPRSAGQLPVYYNRRPRMGWYIDEKSEALFPFGFGLSYTTFRYANLRATAERVSAEITNTGPRSGEEVVQLYVEDLICSFAAPTKRLIGYQRIALEAGQTRTVEFRLNKAAFAALDQKLQPRVEAGEFRVSVAPNSAADQGVSAIVTLV